MRTHPIPPIPRPRSPISPSLPKFLIPVSLLCVSLPAFGQDAVVIEEPLSDGQAAIAPKTPQPTTLTVRETRTLQLKDRKLTIHRIADPGFPDPSLVTKAKELTPADLDQWRDSPEAQEWRSRANQHTTHLVLAATVVDGRATLLRWWHEGQELQAWSNTDWRIMSGFQACRKGDQRFVTLMLTGSLDSASLEADSPYRIPSSLPTGMANFVLSKGEHAAETPPYKAIIALHELYRSDGERLLAAYKERVDKRERQILKPNPPAPQDITLHLWKIAPTKKSEGGAQ